MPRHFARPRYFVAASRFSGRRTGCERGPGSGRPLDAVLLHPRAQGARLHAQSGRRAILTLDLPVRAVENVANVLTLQLVQRDVGIGLNRAAIRARERCRATRTR
jgi:hypothetical protein